MGETSGGQLRFVRQETPITPKHLSQFGIEVDEALCVWGEGQISGGVQCRRSRTGGLQTESESFK